MMAPVMAMALLQVGVGTKLVRAKSDKDIPKPQMQDVIYLKQKCFQQVQD